MEAVLLPDAISAQTCKDTPNPEWFISVGVNVVSHKLDSPPYDLYASTVDHWVSKIPKLLPTIPVLFLNFKTLSYI